MGTEVALPGGEIGAAMRGGRSTALPLEEIVAIDVAITIEVACGKCDSLEAGFKDEEVFLHTCDRDRVVKHDHGGAQIVFLRGRLPSCCNHHEKPKRLA